MRLGVHAVQDCVIAPGSAPAVSGHDLRRYLTGLVMLVIGNVELNGLSPVAVCPKLLALAPGIVADDGVCRVEYARGAAVVLLKADDAAVFVFILKGQYVLYRCAAEFIDALVVIAHNADIAPAARELRCKQVLEPVGILIFVDEHIFEAFLPVFADVVVLVEELNGIIDKVVKVHRAGGEGAAGVFGIDLRYFYPAGVSRGPRPGGILLCGQAFVLSPAYLGKQHARRIALIVKIKVLQYALYKAHTVGGIVDGKALREAEAFCVTAEDAHTGRMEGGGPDLASGRAEHILKP